MAAASKQLASNCVSCQRVYPILTERMEGMNRCVIDEKDCRLQLAQICGCGVRAVRAVVFGRETRRSMFNVASFIAGQ